MRRVTAASIGALIVLASVAPRLRAVAHIGDGPTASSVPLVTGLIAVKAVHEPQKGDYESILKVSAVAPDGVTFTVSANIQDRRISVRRKVKRQDMESAHAWRPRYHEDDPEIYDGTTGGLGVSSAVLNDLKTRRETTISAFIADDAVNDLMKGLFGGAGIGLPKELADASGTEGWKGTLRRVEMQPVPVSVLLNDVRVELPTIHARGTLGDEDAELFILDNPSLPMVLRYRVGDIASQTIKIVVPADPATATQELETRLSKAGRAEVYGIYFDFGKASIRPESDAVLKEIADVMSRNPAWKLQVEGHTDNIGSTASNQELSVRRTAAVRQALIDRYRITGDRLTTQGFGASRPKETNDTLEGRARNRRVELVRQGT
jgi:outer membrane protein OmpA-like peptidoglycan-associated protein